MKNDQITIVGKRIRELRNDKKLSQGELGKLLSVSQDTVSLWEQSKSLTSIEMILALSEIFGVSCDYLLGKTDY